jgi:hypothetical protein
MLQMWLWYKKCIVGYNFKYGFHNPNRYSSWINIIEVILEVFFWNPIDEFGGLVTQDIWPQLYKLQFVV